VFRETALAVGKKETLLPCSCCPKVPAVVTLELFRNQPSFPFLGFDFRFPFGALPVAFLFAASFLGKVFLVRPAFKKTAPLSRKRIADDDDDLFSDLGFLWLGVQNL